MAVGDKKRVLEEVHGEAAGASMSAPTALQLKRTYWMDFDEYMDIDYENGTLALKEDAPKDVIESYRLFMEG